MASRREAVIEAVVSALNGAGKPSELTIHRSRTRPIDKDDLPVQIVYIISETLPTTYGVPAVDREVLIAVETRVVGNPPDEALDPYLSWTIQALLPDHTLDGTALNIIEQGTEWTADELDKIYGAAQQQFRITYRTRHDDPDQVA